MMMYLSSSIFIDGQHEETSSESSLFMVEREPEGVTITQLRGITNSCVLKHIINDTVHV